MFLPIECEPRSCAKAVRAARTQSGKGEERSVPCWRVRGVHKGEQSVLMVNLGERNFFAAPGRSLGVR